MRTKGNKSGLFRWPEIEEGVSERALFALKEELRAVGVEGCWGCG